MRIFLPEACRLGNLKSTLLTWVTTVAQRADNTHHPVVSQPQRMNADRIDATPSAKTKKGKQPAISCPIIVPASLPPVILQHGGPSPLDAPDM